MSQYQYTPAVNRNKRKSDNHKEDDDKDVYGIEDVDINVDGVGDGDGDILENFWGANYLFSWGKVLRSIPNIIVPRVRCLTRPVWTNSSSGVVPPLASPSWNRRYPPASG